MWLAGFFNPQSFLTAIMQSMARKNEWPLDKMCLSVEVTKKNREDMTAPPREGAYVYGLFMEGKGRAGLWKLLELVLLGWRLALGKGRLCACCKGAGGRGTQGDVAVSLELPEDGWHGSEHAHTRSGGDRVTVLQTSGWPCSAEIAASSQTGAPAQGDEGLSPSRPWGREPRLDVHLVGER